MYRNLLKCGEMSRTQIYWNVVGKVLTSNCLHYDVVKTVVKFLEKQKD